MDTRVEFTPWSIAKSERHDWTTQHCSCHCVDPSLDGGMHPAGSSSGPQANQDLATASMGPWAPNLFGETDRLTWTATVALASPSFTNTSAKLESLITFSQAEELDAASINQP